MQQYSNTVCWLLAMMARSMRWKGLAGKSIFLFYRDGPTATTGPPLRASGWLLLTFFFA
jgi:hypothetical protein